MQLIKKLLLIQLLFLSSLSLLAQSLYDTISFEAFVNTNFDLTIYNQFGQLKFSQHQTDANFPLDLDISDFAAGIYLIKTTYKIKEYTQKIVKLN